MPLSLILMVMESDFLADARFYCLLSASVQPHETLASL